MGVPQRGARRYVDRSAYFSGGRRGGCRLRGRASFVAPEVSVDRSVYFLRGKEPPSNGSAGCTRRYRRCTGEDTPACEPTGRGNGRRAGKEGTGDGVRTTATGRAATGTTARATAGGPPLPGPSDARASEGPAGGRWRVVRRRCAGASPRAPRPSRAPGPPPRRAPAPGRRAASSPPTWCSGRPARAGGSRRPQGPVRWRRGGGPRRGRRAGRRSSRWRRPWCGRSGRRGRA